MPITIQWHNDEKTVMAMVFTGDWNWTEFYEAAKDGRELADTSDKPYYIVMDFSDRSGYLPPSAMTHFRNAAKDAHPNRKGVVITSKTTYLAVMVLRVVNATGIIKYDLVIEGDHDKAYQIAIERAAKLQTTGGDKTP